MKRITIVVLVAPVAVGLVALMAARAARAGGEVGERPTDWAINATAIEACTCPMFCQCYFSTRPAAHHDHATGQTRHFCKFNVAYRVNQGQYGKTRLDGVKFWTSGDLGESFADREIDWTVRTFDPAVTQEQRAALAAILSNLSRSRVKEFKIGEDATIDWKVDKDRAVALLDRGKAGEVVLKRFQGNTDEPVVIKNLKYWSAPRNDGFILMPSEVQAYRRGERTFESRGTNGFVITFEINSKDVQSTAKPAM